MLRKPDWLRTRIGGGDSYATVKQTLGTRGLHTICASGRCPNQGECWEAGTATFLLLGNICTRNCRFCATPTGQPLPPDTAEPEKIAQSVRILQLKHVVLTSVDRDDLPDGGASHWSQVIASVRRQNPTTSIEVLLPDFMQAEEALNVVINASPDILAHNLETVERLTPFIRSRAQYRYSLQVLEQMAASGIITKSGLMLGLGETPEEVLQAIEDLHAAGCQVLTLGQYLQPTRKHVEVARYIPPSEFEALAAHARAIGFRYVESGPLVRSSFHAERALASCGIQSQKYTH